MIGTRVIQTKSGTQTGYEVYDMESGQTVERFMNRDFGGVSFWKRAKDAAYARVVELNDLSLMLGPCGK